MNEHKTSGSIFEAVRTLCQAREEDAASMYRCTMSNQSGHRVMLRRSRRRVCPGTQAHYEQTVWRKRASPFHLARLGH
jgi:hypothetical protein